MFALLRELNQCLLVPTILLSTWGWNESTLRANPAGATVSQGGATFTTAGSQLTIRTSDHAAINWQSFNIGLGQTTTFVQPSSSSVVWNQINDPNPSQILGNLNANGYVVLQNQAGFYIGGQALINTHGLLLTTAANSVPDLASGGAWDFSAPPPTASIVNYGQIKVGVGGSAFLIAENIENHGTISAPGGSIGLYAGKDVLISERPDGRGLSAQVTLPQGSVDNAGNLIADGGTIALHAKVVNQGGLIQADSVRNENGIIELVAGDALNLGANSILSAHGGSVGNSSGGSIAVKSGDSFSDQMTSVIDISGGSQGGNGGQVEISAPRMSAIHSTINGQTAYGFVKGKLTVDPLNIQLVSSGGNGTSAEYSSGIVDSTDPSETLMLDVGSFASTLSQINLQAINTIQLSTIWNLPAASMPATLTLTAGNSIILDGGSAIKAGKNWSVNLTAGPQNLSATPASGSDGIYLNGSSFIDALNGNITLWAANDVMVNSGAVRTRGGGNINVTAQFGDVNTGNNINGYNFVLPATSPSYYKVSATTLGGISTAAGGDVAISAGNDVISYLPTQSDYNSAKYDAGAGAFGSQPGNVSITAGRNVLGHYVLGNGVGVVTAGGNIGAPGGGLALSLIKGSWDVEAPHGSIYLQDVRNPNGIFGDHGSALSYAGYHLFDYDPFSSLTLHAGDSVEITGIDAPHNPPSAGADYIPLILPPTLKVTTDSGDFILDASVVLFPSPYGNVKITTAGNFLGVASADGVAPNFQMSDSGSARWVDSSSFGTQDHAAVPLELNNPDPVQINVGGSLKNVNLYTTKATQIDVHGDMINASFTGENLHSADVTSINVDGAIRNSPLYSFVKLDAGIASANPLQPNAWDSVFALALNADMLATLATLDANRIPTDSSRTFAQNLAYYLNNHGYLLFSSGENVFQSFGSNPGFQYVSSGLQLGFKGNMAAAQAAGTLTTQQLNALESGQFTVLVADAHGNPVVDMNGHLQTRTYTFGAASKIASLYAASLEATANTTPLSGLQIGGPGLFKIHAASLDLGNSQGIISWGIASGIGSEASGYSSLAGLTSSGAAVDLEVDGNLSMFTSTIASVFGGNVDVHAGGTIDLSLPGLSFTPSGHGYICYGIYTSGHSDVNVTAQGSININNSRIGAFNGGNVFVKSLGGDVNAGTGANSALFVPIVYQDQNSGAWISGQIGNPSNPLSLKNDPTPYGSGILAFSPTTRYQVPGDNGLPGNILVETPQGNIVSTLGGIMQLSLGSGMNGTPSVTLIAGTPASGVSPSIPGNVLLGQGGVIGGTINVTAEGNIQGFIVSKENANISAADSFSGAVFSGGTANVSAGGSISGTLAGIGGVSASGGGDVSATMLSQNVSVGGQQQASTLGTAATAGASSQAAANQATSDAKEQVASNNVQEDDEEKKRKKQPSLTRRVGRVTVLLPKAM